MSNKSIESKLAPAAIGPYSQAIETDPASRVIYVSGQLPVDGSTGAMPEDITGQTTQSLENIKVILEEAGMTMDNIVKTTVLLSDIGNFTAMNEVYGQYFSKPFPARAAFQVAALPKAALVEIEAVAVG